MFFVSSNVRRTLVKVPLQQLDTEDKHLIKQLWVNKKSVANQLLKMFFLTEDED